MPEFRQQLILLKPMHPGVSGYARLQSERGRLLAQLNARGLDVDGVQAYWYGAGGEARLMGQVRVNAHGEASLTAELPTDALAPERLQALLLLSDGAEPAPLMIGLCVRQSAGSLLFPLGAGALGVEAGRHWTAAAAAMGGFLCIWLVKPTAPAVPGQPRGPKATKQNQKRGLA